MNKLNPLLVTLMAFVLAFQTSLAQDEVQLRLAWWGSQNRHDRTIAAIELYEELNPGIDIVAEFDGWWQYWEMLEGHRADSDLPDILQNTYARIADYIDTDSLLPLDDYIEDGALDIQFIDQNSLSGATSANHLYGIPLGVNAEVVALDTDAFAAAEMELPPLDWTWADFEEIASQLAERLGIYGIGELGSEEIWKTLYLGCCDQWAYAADGKSIGYEDDQPLIDFYSMLLRLQDNGGMQPYADWIARGNQGIVEAKLIVTGEAAMDYLGSNQLLAMWGASGADRNFVLYPFPRVEDGVTQSFIKPSMYFSIASDTEYPDEAAAFLDWFVNSIEANEILAAERGVPLSAHVRDALLPTLGPAQAETFTVLGTIETTGRSFLPFDPPADREIVIEVYIPDFAKPVMFGEISPEEGAARLREGVNRMLAAQ